MDLFRPKFHHPLRNSSLLGILMFTALFSVLHPAAAQTSSAGQTQLAQPKLPAVEILAGIHKIRAEVASDPASRSQGLMFREGLGPNEGMLFVFERPGSQCFWMRNTRIPLSIAFIDDNGRVVNMADMKPLDESSHCSVKPVRFALEMDQGWFARRGISAGMALINEKIFAADPKR